MVLTFTVLIPSIQKWWADWKFKFKKRNFSKNMWQYLTSGRMDFIINLEYVSISGLKPGGYSDYVTVSGPGLGAHSFTWRLIETNLLPSLKLHGFNYNFFWIGEGFNVCINWEHVTAPVFGLGRFLYNFFWIENISSYMICFQTLNAF